jgi:hypothetical protein
VGGERLTRADFLAALSEAEEEGEPVERVNDSGPALEVLEISEAERLAQAAEAPRGRQEGWKRQRPLTSQQQAFVAGVIEGKSYRQAYRDAYQTQGSDQTVASAAWRLSRDPRIMAMIQASEEERMESLAEDQAAARRYVMRRLLGLSKVAKQEGSQLKALELLGRAAGMWREQQRAEAAPLTAADLRAALGAHLRMIGDTVGGSVQTLGRANADPPEGEPPKRAGDHPPAPNALIHSSPTSSSSD